VIKCILIDGKLLNFLAYFLLCFTNFFILAQVVAEAKGVVLRREDGARVTD
jgi:hypothetical protein